MNYDLSVPNKNDKSRYRSNISHPVTSVADLAALLPALRAIGILTRTGAHHLAKEQNVPVVVPAEARPRTPETQLFYVAYPNNTDTVETGGEAVADAMRFYSHAEYLLQDRDTLALAHYRICHGCGLGYPLSEFTNHPYYCRHIECMETPDDNDGCRECLRAAVSHAQSVAAKECFA